MNRIYAFLHPQLLQSSDFLERLQKCCRRNGLSLSVEETVANAFGQLQFDSCRAGQCDAILSAGGDGTFLRANAVAYQFHLPVIGVNLGTVGFLTDIEKNRLEEAVAAIKENRFTVEERMMMRISVMEKQYFALNDAVLSRGDYTRLLHFHTEVDHRLIGSYRADGLIISTPTGSTAYSLSAGGPIICPDVECMLLTPICPHTLQHRPIVAGPNSTIIVKPDSGCKAILSVDGRNCLQIDSKVDISAEKADQKAQFLRIQPYDFFEKIRYKLSAWSAEIQEE